MYLGQRTGIAPTVAVAMLIVLVALGGGASYYAYMRTQSSTSSDSSSSQNATSTTCCTSSSSISTSATSTASSSSLSCPYTGSVTETKGDFVLPPCSSEIIIPPGIDTSNAENKITFLPENLTVVIGINNTVFFVNQDNTSNLGHVIQSVDWPTNAEPFGPFDLLPGWTANVTLTTPGVYYYQCTWHPVWMEGVITVLS